MDICILLWTIPERSSTSANKSLISYFLFDSISSDTSDTIRCELDLKGLSLLFQHFYKVIKSQEITFDIHMYIVTKYELF